MMKKRIGVLAFLIAVTLLIPVASATDTFIVPSKRFGLDWTTELGPNDQIALLRIFYTMDGGRSWKLYSETENPTSPAPIKVKTDGTYGFYTQCQDKSGLEEEKPTPNTSPKGVVIVDTTKPVLVLTSPNTSDVYPSSQDIRIEWNSSDANFSSNPISLFYSKDGGGTWNLIQKDIANTGSYIWKLPAESSELYRVKVSAIDRAGNSNQAVSDKNFIVDGMPPVSQVTGPTEARSASFDVSYNVRDYGGAGVAKVELYYQVNGAGEWFKYGEDTDLTSPIRFVAKTGGRYGFKVVATDRVGNREPSPTATTVADITCLMDSVPPVVKLLNFKGSNIKPVGYEISREILWEANDDNMASNPIKLEYTLDGTKWVQIHPGLPNSGKYPWTLRQNANSETAKIRITAMDELGNTSSDISSPFKIDSIKPVSSIRKIVAFPGDNAQESNIKQAPSPSIQQPQKPSLETQINRAKSSVKGNDWSSAQNFINSGLALDSQNADLHNLQGEVHQAKNKTAQAERSFMQALKANPIHHAANINLGLLNIDRAKSLVKTNRDEAKKSFQNASNYLDQAIKVQPDLFEEYYYQGYAYAYLSLYDLAIKQFKKAGDLDKSNGNPYWFLGELYKKKGKKADAIAAYQEAMKRYPKNSSGWQKSKNQIDFLKQ